MTFSPLQSSDVAAVLAIDNSLLLNLLQTLWVLGLGDNGAADD